jgi:hypothetical protein
VADGALSEAKVADRQSGERPPRATPMSVLEAGNKKDRLVASAGDPG